MEKSYTLILLFIMTLAGCKKIEDNFLKDPSITEVRIDFANSTIDEQNIVFNDESDNEFDPFDDIINSSGEDSFIDEDTIDESIEYDSGDLDDDPLPLMNKSHINLDNDHYLDIELTLNDEKNVVNNAIRENAGNQAALVNRDLVNGTRYKVAVFNGNGTFNSERNYIKGSESNTARLYLDRGKAYTFVVYSVNSTSNLPAITFASNTNRTLASSTIGLSNVATSNVDFMYYSWYTPNLDLPVIGLNITFRHVFSRLFVRINSSFTGYNITRPTINFSANYNNAVINLNNGSVSSRSGLVAPNIVFPQTNANILLSLPFIINNSNNSTSSLNLVNLTIGTKTLNNGAINNLSVIAGASQTLNLTVRPADAILGNNSVRIAGTVWQRVNRGSSATDPDTYSSRIFGGYYQFGYSLHIRNGLLGPGQKTFSRRGRTDPTYWNSNRSGLAARERNPIKGSADPCAAGFRLPTNNEYRKLRLNTVLQNARFVRNSYATGFRLRSRTNRNVLITFPAQGRLLATGNGLPYNYGGRASLGIFAATRSSYTTTNLNGFMWGNATSQGAAFVRPPLRKTYVMAYPVRCIRNN